MGLSVIYQSSKFGNVTFTSNTKVESNVFIGNTQTFSSPEYAEWLAEELPINQPHVITVDKGNGNNDYYSDTVVYFTDYGHSLWATERLAPEELAVFIAQVAVWSTHVSTVKSDANFNYWWSRFSNDPHVTVLNT